MSSDLRSAILQTARRLFNQHGFKRVTMRMISDSLGISVGNLTYHFSRKSDIVQALMAQNMQETVPNVPVGCLMDLEKTLERMIDSLDRNLFFFSEPEFYLSDSDHATFSQGNHVWRQMYQTVDRLIALGLFSADFSGEVQKNVLDMLMLSHIPWLQQRLHHVPDSMPRGQFIRAHWLILHSFLTQEGQRQYHESIAPYLSKLLAHE